MRRPFAAPRRWSSWLPDGPGTRSCWSCRGDGKAPVCLAREAGGPWSPHLTVYLQETGIPGRDQGINMMETIDCRLRSGRREGECDMFTRILLAIDDSASSDAAISFATAMARQSSASVRIVHVNEFLVGGRGTTVETQAQAIAHLENAVNALRSEGIPTEGALYLT